jgi:BirA family biotin operon repressor/biotin-[acetyl-CoA-carboxylase] ligase
MVVRRVPAVLSRVERFDRVESTNDVVRRWLDGGVPEVCVAVADEQAAGRGRAGRTWSAARGAALLCSVGFRPSWLAADRAWQLGAIVSLAAAEAAERVVGLEHGAIWLKWPNDLVTVRSAADGGFAVRKLAGVLGESDGLGTDDPRVVVGIGLNADWPRAAFPPGIADSMTSLAEVADGAADIDREAVLDVFLEEVAQRTLALQAGEFDAAGWSARQVTTGREVRLEMPSGDATAVTALGVDPATGALVVADPLAGERHVLVGEIRHLRLGPRHPVGV